VLADGRIVADGPHDRLVHTCPVYQALVREQLGDAAPRLTLAA
jgi:ABC-type multidrug transport system fused ATPase/permease subunit